MVIKEIWIEFHLFLQLMELIHYKLLLQAVSQYLVGLLINHRVDAIEQEIEEAANILDNLLDKDGE